MPHLSSSLSSHVSSGLVPRTLAALALVAALAACGSDKTTGPATGTLNVTVASTGIDVDSGGYTIAVDNGTPQPIGANGTATVPNIAAGDHSVTLASLPSNCTVSGSNPANVTVTAGATASASFQVACVAREIAFTTDRNGNFEIFTMNDDGTGVTRVTNDPGQDVLPAWSPDGAQLAFSSSRGFGIGVLNVFVADPTNGTILHQLTNLPSENARLSWSPDGSKIAFASTRTGTDSTQAEIWVMNADGTGQTQLTSFNAFSTDPSWSPDGAHIVFQSNKDGTDQIYTMDASGGSVTRLTTNTNDDRSPAWSPDGSKIVFSSNRDAASPADSATEFEIYVMNADGSSPTRLTTSPGFDGEPSWSADGRKIIFSSDRAGHTQIFTMDATGANQVNVSNTSSNDGFARFKP